MDRRLYIKSGDDVKRGYGAVLDIRCNKDKANCVNVINASLVCMLYYLYMLHTSSALNELTVTSFIAIIGS